MRTERETFSNLLILLVAVLVFLPFITTFQDVLTRIVLYFDWYKALEKFVVPYELRVTSAILSFFALQTRAGPSYIEFIKDGRHEVIYLIWNCIGWQSFVFLGVTLVTGLSGKYTYVSKIQAFLIGILGTYLINIFRIVLVIVIYYFTGRGIGVVFHDYFSNLLSILWLFIFWWLVYSYVLEEVQPSRGRDKKVSAIIQARDRFKTLVLSSKYYVLWKVTKLKLLNRLLVFKRGKKDTN